MNPRPKCGKCGADLVCHCPVCEGALGGKKAAKGMTAQERKERAKKAAKARWAVKSP